MIPLNYDIKINVHGMPQRVASGFQNVFDKMLGSTYEFVSYLGSKKLNNSTYRFCLFYIIHFLQCKTYICMHIQYKIYPNFFTYSYIIYLPFLR